MDNIATILTLKNAQYGLELYSTIFGVVYLKGVNDNLTIAVYDKNKIARYFNKYGQYFEGFDDAECQLFPAKGMSWEEWKQVVHHKFKIGDWIISKDKNRIYQITDIRGKKYFYNNTVRYDYINIADDMYDLWSIQDAKPGDILVANGAPFIYKSHDNSYVFHYCGINLGDEFVVSEKDNSIWNSNTEITPANQMQCDNLFRKMEDSGYVWDPDKKVLSKKTKFKVGDWIISDHPDAIFKVGDLKKTTYKLIDIYGDSHDCQIIEVDKNYHLWSVQDAKSGDILVDNVEGFKNPLIFILKKFEHVNYGLVKPSDYSSYCFLTASDNPRFKEGHFHHMHDIKPSTKEQKDLLFSKMDEAGYTWEPLYKELVRKTKFKVGDWITDGSCKVKITSINNTYYFFSKNSIIGEIESIDKKYHLWTIDDAKPGDIVVYEGEISIFKNNIKNSKENSFGGFAYYYCWDGKTFFTDNFYSLTEDDKCNIHLATLEESELIHSQLTNSGYEWDLDKKVLSKKAKFKIGDWVVNNKDKRASQITETICDKKDPNTLYGYVHTNGFFANSFENVYHLWTIKDAKDGDILSAKIDGDDYILLFKRIKDGWIETYGHYYITIDKFCTPTQMFCRDYQGTLYPATQKQRYMLFKKMREAGYQWYADKKDLKKIQSHYDITNFYAGMPVLVRDDDSDEWNYLFFSHYRKKSSDHFFAGGNPWFQCIPFGEDTKHLLGTTDMCPEEYINW